MESLIYSRNMLKVVMISFYLSFCMFMLILQKTKEELEALQNENEEEVSEVDNPYKVYLKAVMLMLVGAILAGIFADPLVDAVDNFSDATSIPSFFISCILMPLATNSSEGVAAFTFASRKKKRTASLVYSQVIPSSFCIYIFLFDSRAGIRCVFLCALNSKCIFDVSLTEKTFFQLKAMCTSLLTDHSLDFMSLFDGSLY